MWAWCEQHGCSFLWSFYVLVSVVSSLWSPHLCVSVSSSRPNSRWQLFFKSRVYQKAGGTAVNYGWLVYPPRSTQGGKTSVLTSAAKGLNSTEVTVHLVILFTNTLKCRLCLTYKDQTLNFHPFCSPHVWKPTKLIKTQQLQRKWECKCCCRLLDCFHDFM